jgi:hypothetical protein
MASAAKPTAREKRREGDIAADRQRSCRVRLRCGAAAGEQGRAQRDQRGWGVRTSTCEYSRMTSTRRSDGDGTWWVSGRVGSGWGGDTSSIRFSTAACGGRGRCGVSRATPPRGTTAGTIDRLACYLALPHNPHNVHGSQAGRRSRSWGQPGVGAETVGCSCRIMRGDESPRHAARRRCATSGLKGYRVRGVRVDPRSRSWQDELAMVLGTTGEQ